MTTEALEEALDPTQAPQRWPQPRRSGWTGGNKRKDLGMAEREIPYAVRHLLQELLPRIGIVASHGLVVELVHHRLDYTVEKLFTARHIPVEGHGLNTQPRAKATHGEPIPTELVDEPDGLPDNQVLVERPPRTYPLGAHSLGQT